MQHGAKLVVGREKSYGENWRRAAGVGLLLC